MAGFDEHLKYNFVHGLVQSAIERGLDPAARLQQFRTLQQVTDEMTLGPDVARAAEQILRAINLALGEADGIATFKSETLPVQQ